MFIEIHMLQNHSPANLNRDDVGAPKTAMFGGFLRARISSQCLKRSVRRSETFRNMLPGSIGIRTVSLPALVEEELENSSIPENERAAVVAACTRIAEKEKDAPEPEQTGEEKEDERPRTAQLIFLSPAEAREFVKRLEKARGEMESDYKAFLAVYGAGKKTGGKISKKFWELIRESFKYDAVDIALFGRMTTSSAFENIEAAMQVAHAISTNEVITEVDYFTAVDDIKRGPGSAYLEQGQFNSATFYKYFSLDWEQFLKNLAGDIDLASKALSAFLKAAACTVPTGKKNSFGNNNLPDAILVEVKKQRIPTNYANAFLIPAKPYTDSRGRQDMMADSIEKLAHYVAAIAEKYSIDSNRLWFTTRSEIPFEAADPVASIDQLAGKALELVSTQEIAK